MHPETQPTPASNQRVLFISFAINGGMALAGVVAGLWSGSLALLSDAVHNAGDSLALLLAFLAAHWANAPSSLTKTFGNKRFEILAAFFNAFLLIATTGFLIYKSVGRLFQPVDIDTSIMLPVAFLGLFANLFAVVLLHRHRRETLNLRAAYLHLLGDSFSSLAVIGAGLLVAYFRLGWVDPVFSILIGLFIIYETKDVVKESVSILMHWVPEETQIPEIQVWVEEIPEVANIHHVHLWRLNDRETHLEMHLDLTSDLPVSETGPVREKVEQLLREKFGISHVTIQFEFNHCLLKDTVATGH